MYFDESMIYRNPDPVLDPTDRKIVDAHRKGFSLAVLVSMSYRRPGEVMRLLGLPPEHFGERAMEEAASAWKVIEECRIENQLARTPRRY
jgi:hypothetical protein